MSYKENTKKFMNNINKKIRKKIKKQVKKLLNKNRNIADDSYIPTPIEVETPIQSIDMNRELCNPKIIQLMNTVSGINLDTIKPPRMVVVGTQSSGKSSVLNGIMGIEILPTGKDMVTRSPLVLELQNADDSYAVFGHYLETGAFHETRQIVLDSTDALIEIHNEIEETTKRIAGGGMMITKQPIYLRIFGPKVPIMTLVDLPGLTMLAREDQGQPTDIKQQIRALVTEFIQEPSTIIMCVMAARSDLETDMGLDLVKEVDPEGVRTMGILTKVDLMNADSNIVQYLTGKCSSSLKLKYNYYAVRNKTSQEASLSDAKQVESEYFRQHPLYGELQDRTGIQVVSVQITKYLMSKIQETLPNIKNKIAVETNKIESTLRDIGRHIPIHNVSETLNVIDSTLLSKLVRIINLELNSAGTQGVYGSKLRNLFCEYRSNVRKNYIVPTTDELNVIISNSQGNHMDFAVSPITIVEYCMLNGQFKTMQKDSEQLVVSVINCLNELAQSILGIDQFSTRFPAFIDELINIMNDKVWDKTKINTSISELILFETSYLWTENKEFREALTKAPPVDNNGLVEHIQTLCRLYMETVHETFGNIIPKMCMKYLVNNCYNIDFICKQHLQTYSIERLQYLLSEDKPVVEKRIELESKYTKLKTARNILMKY